MAEHVGASKIVLSNLYDGSSSHSFDCPSTGNGSLPCVEMLKKSRFVVMGNEEPWEQFGTILQNFYNPRDGSLYLLVSSSWHDC